MRFLSFDLNVVTIFQNQIFIFNDFQNNKIIDLFNTSHIIVNRNDFPIDNNNDTDYIYNKKIDFILIHIIRFIIILLIKLCFIQMQTKNP